MQKQVSLDSLLRDIAASTPQLAYVTLDRGDLHVAHGTLPTATPSGTGDDAVPATAGATQVAERERAVASGRVLEFAGPIAIGDFVQVSGTGGDGLRVHASANVSSEVRYVAIESEVFQVKDGPKEGDGYTWWQLEDPYNKTVVGWGVSLYLNAVQNPD